MSGRKKETFYGVFGGRAPILNPHRKGARQHEITAKKKKKKGGRKNETEEKGRIRQRSVACV
jgi:hypothetical protein